MNVEQLYQAHSKRIESYAMRHLGDRYKAEDIMQSTFMAAHIKRADLAKHDSPVRWLYVSAFYLILKVQKAEKREAPMEEIAMLPYIRSDELWEVLPITLSALDRQIAEMLFDQQMQHKEIAEALGITLAACQSRVRRLRQKLKEEFAKTAQMWQNMDEEGKS